MPRPEVSRNTFWESTDSAKQYCAYTFIRVCSQSRFAVYLSDHYRVKRNILMVKSPKNRTPLIFCHMHTIRLVLAPMTTLWTVPWTTSFQIRQRALEMRIEGMGLNQPSVTEREEPLATKHDVS